ncbi:MAG: hypothetical protein PHF17_02320 [Arcobacteraceae bacterium]|jgi:hypothetical protein|nr:hypothetical protein [Arcobacteraceae bacterium]
MVVDTISLKTEALLLFCRDLINTYNQENQNQNSVFIADEYLKEFIKSHIDNLQKGINAILQPNDYYIRNMKVTRIRLIIKFYNQINKMLSNYLKEDNRFSPAMLLFSMLATWFKELGYEKNSKEFIFFSIYPYSEIYDMLLLNVKDLEYKKLNINMIQIAENVIIRLNKEPI